jgi:hypothetical protein
MEKQAGKNHHHRTPRIGSGNWRKKINGEKIGDWSATNLRGRQRGAEDKSGGYGAIGTDAWVWREGRNLGSGVLFCFRYIQIQGLFLPSVVLGSFFFSVHCHLVELVYFMTWRHLVIKMFLIWAANGTVLGEQVETPNFFIWETSKVLNSLTLELAVFTRETRQILRTVSFQRIQKWYNSQTNPNSSCSNQKEQSPTKCAN